MTWLAVALGAALGSACRYLIDRAVGRPPWGVLLANLVASLLAGVVAGAAPGGTLTALLAVGVLGGLSTASTLAADVLRLYDDGARRTAALDVLLSIGPGLALAAVGVAVGRAL